MNSKISLSINELYGFADKDFVYKLQKKYARYFNKSPVLDLGCGRGIFLEILKEVGVKGIGVDDSKTAFDYAMKKNLTVYKTDAFDFLKRAIKEGKKIEGIFCSHMIEHLTVEKAQELLDLCSKVLDGGGKLIIITPNPKDLRVVTDIFWLDRTHVRLYPIDLLKLLLDKAGFKIKELGVDGDTRLKHFQTNLFDKISKFFLSKTPLAPYLNTGHDIFIIAEK